MKLTHLTPVLNVSDIEASLAWFEALGWERAGAWGDPPDFAGVQSGEHAEIFLCRNAQGSQGSRPPEHPFDEGTGGVWMSWFLAGRQEFDAAYARASELGYEISLEPAEQPWGTREFHLRHPDGHTFRVTCNSD